MKLVEVNVQSELKGEFTQKMKIHLLYTRGEHL